MQRSTILILLAEAPNEEGLRYHYMHHDSHTHISGLKVIYSTVYVSLHTKHTLIAKTSCNIAKVHIAFLMHDMHAIALYTYNNILIRIRIISCLTWPRHSSSLKSHDKLR